MTKYRKNSRRGRGRGRGRTGRTQKRRRTQRGGLIPKPGSPSEWIVSGRDPNE